MKTLLCLSACILLFSGCIKDPPIPNPNPQPNPDWLIKKFTVIDASSEDGNLNYTYFVKSV